LIFGSNHHHAAKAVPGWHDAGCAPRRRPVSVPAIVFHRQEVRPMNAASAVGAPLQSTIARLR